MRTADQLAGRVRASGDLKLIPYVMAGYPTADAAVETAVRYSAAGAAAVEVGIPFSDPLADGPVVQFAAQTALDQGTRVHDCIEMASRIAAASSSPVVLMTYVNPVLAYGVDRFAADAASAHVAGVIIPDLPAEEAGAVATTLQGAGLDTVFLVAPTSPDQRIAAAAAASSGFLYCVTLTGITGARDQLPAGLEELLARVRSLTDLPVAAGFGLSRPDHMSRLRGKADAAVVASALLAETQAGRDPLPLLEALLQACR